MEGGEKGTVCVTGGTGYVASWLIMRLLQQGYTVHTTIRSNPDRKRDVSYLTKLPGASERLQIFNADLDNPESFNAPIEGCIGVFHLAHALDFEGKEPQEILNQRGISGVLGILQACLNSNTVKRVVYTSSGSTVLFNGKDLEEVSEESWSDVDYIGANFEHIGAPYFISKTVTERAAVDFAEKHGLDLLITNAFYIHGPFITPSCPLSVHLSLALIFGDVDNFLPLLLKFPMVHVDDVARAHIFLLEYPKAKGRYICSALEITINKMAEFLSARYPEFQMRKTDFLKEIKGPKYPSPSSKKLLDTGFKFKYGLEQMYDEAIQCCKKKGFL